MTIEQDFTNYVTGKIIDLALHGKCPDGYLDHILYWAQRGDLDPLVKVFESRKGSLRLKPAMLKFLAEVLRRAKKRNKKFPRMATADRQFEIATFVYLNKDHIGLIQAYKEAAKKFRYKNTRQIRAIWKKAEKFVITHFWELERLDLNLEAKNALKIYGRKLGIRSALLDTRYEIDTQGLKQHFFPGSGN